MPPQMYQFFNPLRFIPEIIYTLIIFIICFLIYFKTKEAYNLTKHKGIGYFRDAFLLFGLAYVMRFIFEMINFSTKLFHIFLPRYFLFPLSLLILSYLSTMGILYLVFSSVWKNIKRKNFVLYGHLTAMAISIAIFITRSHQTLILLQIALLIFAIVLNFIKTKKTKKVSQAIILHLLIFIFWILNLWMISPRCFLPRESMILIQTISLIVFGVIYFKVLKWLK
ncbi:MAG: hypothetical protein ABIC91_04880 [Nanoarchaeota archaeon]|nr:hypothetical protein [Nanoarchaeota archaeon]MBU1031139.1 hypothetical protein [Nanoarchaeota archaeon]MBU1850142.1 hypothetical protein [Nanoarchaeota archaeon]